MNIFSSVPRYRDDPSNLDRLGLRKQFLVDAVQDQVTGKRMLDLAAHDGRWSYAYAHAGATEIVGVEARQDLVDEFASYPSGLAKDRVRLVCSDVFAYLDQAVAQGQTFDTVALLGFYYHTMEHYRLLKLIRQLGAQFIIVDSVFITNQSPMMRFIKERTENPLNAIADFEGQTTTIKGVPSVGAMDAMAQVLGYRVEWADWDIVPEESRSCVAEYFQAGSKIRKTCYLHRTDSTAD